MWPLVDNHRDDQYFYQVLVLTGRRKDAGTRSQVSYRYNDIYVANVF